MHRKTAPEVREGRVRKKNNWAYTTDDYYLVRQPLPVIDRKRPGPGFRHLLKKRDIVDFIELLPNWDELSKGLDAIVLAPGDPGRYGWADIGVVHVCAWPAEIWETAHPDFAKRDERMLERLGVKLERERGVVCIRWTEPQARAFQLLDVLLHELGHHHDRMTTRSQIDAARGEPYAEQYAREHGGLIWDRYVQTFGLH